jgi:probable rRNA maturation factor
MEAAKILLNDLEGDSEHNRELSLLFTDDKEIRKLNLKYRNKDKPTDVLSFRLGDGEDPNANKNLLGDIVISVNTAERQAIRNNCTVSDELIRLLIHGVLHLYGYDHEGVTKEKALEMREMEDALWKLLNYHKQNLLSA